MKRPLVVEIVGPAGAGKTTLSIALSQQRDRIRAILHFRRISSFPFFVINAFLLLPVFLQQRLRYEPLTWQTVRLMIHVKSLHQALARGALNNDTVTILDQGPVYMLTRLHGLDIVKTQCLNTWWTSALDDWASTLDVVVHLDAPDEILVERIRTRDKEHVVKQASREEACRFLASCRMSHHEVIAALTANSGPTVLRFDTGQDSLEQVAKRVLAFLESEAAETQL